MPKWFQVLASASAAAYGGLSAFDWTNVIGNQHTLGTITGIIGVIGLIAHAFNPPAVPPSSGANG